MSGFWKLVLHLSLPLKKTCKNINTKSRNKDFILSFTRLPSVGLAVFLLIYVSALEKGIRSKITNQLPLAHCNWKKTKILGHVTYLLMHLFFNAKDFIILSSLTFPFCTLPEWGDMTEINHIHAQNVMEKTDYLKQRIYGKLETRWMHSGDKCLFVIIDICILVCILHTWC